jgi:hypothetical protein
MTLDWQFIITLLFVVAAAAYVVWHLLRGWVGQGTPQGCGGCSRSGCGNRNAAAGKQSELTLVSLGNKTSPHT